MQGPWKYHVIWYLAQTGTLVFGPVDDKGNHLLVLADEWIGPLAPLPREDSLKELPTRFVASHGPCTEKDLARWSGLRLGDVREGLAASSEAMSSVEGPGGEEYFSSTSQLELNPPEPAKMLLLPAFDEYLLGYASRDLVLPPEHAEKICPGNNGVFRPTVVVEGTCVGVWKGPTPGAVSKLAANQPVKISVSPFDSASAKKMGKRALHEAAQSYAAYLGHPQVELTVAE
jgi:hypothetical protein